LLFDILKYFIQKLAVRKTLKIFKNIKRPGTQTQKGIIIGAARD
jgi:hypothetical protein